MCRSLKRMLHLNLHFNPSSSALSVGKASSPTSGGEFGPAWEASSCVSPIRQAQIQGSEDIGACMSRGRGISQMQRETQRHEHHRNR